MNARRMPGYVTRPADDLLNEAYVTLSAAERGVYDSMRRAMWLDANLSVPSNPDALSVVLRLPVRDVKKGLTARVLARFQLVEDRLTDPELREQEAMQAEKRQRRSEAGREGSRRRWGDRDSSEQCDSNATAEQSQSDSNAMQMAIDGNRSEVEVKRREVEGKVKESSRRSPRTPVPEDFTVSERVKTWAREHGYDRLDERRDCYVSKCKANGYRYADHDSAFMNSIRDDWAGMSRTARRDADRDADWWKVAS